MLWIISGPSSVGKSSFIASSRCGEITGISSESSVFWPANQSDLDEHYGADVLYHYNTLRPMHLKRMSNRPKLARRQAVVTSETAFDQDPSWNALVDYEMDKKTIVLVASKQTILQRARQREAIENLHSTGSQVNRYPVERWLELIERTDLVANYRAWCQELRLCGIEYELVDASNDSYSTIDDETHLSALVNSTSSEYTKNEVEEILRERKFAYHRVELPFGLHTPGDARKETRDLIFPASLKGKGVLDIGSALGYFCFEAEARGAERVVGVELQEERFQDAMILKDIKGSAVDFLRRDILLDPLDESFDYVLLLNVIHHLKEPFVAIRQLASITKDRLVIEFPTLADRKFRDTVDIQDASQYNRLPLVGVSTMTGARQTFVFTPKAIRRSLMDHDRLFKKIDIVRSPMRGRMIAICHKTSDNTL
jgi:2-polyprenyl-3-methyl-5-hydroxy-6-metoxy-1,4-benzoquinol methylase